MANTISIIRKRTVANVPMFSDDENTPQNEWFRLADYTCVDVCPGQTARVYDLEHAENYSNQDNSYYLEFSFESVRQALKPPYDIHEGDYIGFGQGTSIFYYRIVRVYPTQLFAGCCVVQIVINVTNPREAQYLIECGELQALKDEEISGGNIKEGETTNG